MSRLPRIAIVMSLNLLAGCAGAPVGWGGTDEVLFSDMDTIKIQWDNLTTSEDAVRQKAVTHCSRGGRQARLIDAASDSRTLGMIRTKTWKCVGEQAAVTGQPSSIPQFTMAPIAGAQAPVTGQSSSIPQFRMAPIVGGAVGTPSQSQTNLDTSGGVRMPPGVQFPTSAAPTDIAPARRAGKDVLQAEKLARGNQCSANPVAAMAAQGPGFENYSVRCDNSDTLLIRCEFGTCRVLR